MREEPATPKLFSAIRIGAVVLVIVLATLVVLFKGPGTLAAYAESFQENLAVATIIFFGLFLFKSISFGLPYTVLYVAIGHIYPLPVALIINTAGIALNMQIPYFVGRYGKVSFVDRLVEKAGFVKRFRERDENNEVVFAFLVKFIGVVPHEITNLLLGSMKIGYLNYLIGGVGGLLPGMIATTFAGDSMTEPLSPQFIIAVVVFVALLVGSYLLSRGVRRD